MGRRVKKWWPVTQEEKKKLCMSHLELLEKRPWYDEISMVVEHVRCWQGPRPASCNAVNTGHFNCRWLNGTSCWVTWIRSLKPIACIADHSLGKWLSSLTKIVTVTRVATCWRWSIFITDDHCTSALCTVWGELHYECEKNKTRERERGRRHIHRCRCSC